MTHLKRTLNIPNVEHVHTLELLKLQDQMHKINENMKYYKSQMEEYMKEVDELDLHILTMKLFNKYSFLIKQVFKPCPH